MAELFTLIDDSFAILYSRGIYKQRPLYHRGEHVYAAHGGGFIRLVGGHGTTQPNVKWQEIESTDKNLSVPASTLQGPKWIGK